MNRNRKEKRLWRGSNATVNLRGLCAESMNALRKGGTTEGLAMLRDDLVHAEISFKELARQTGFGEKSLPRMRNDRGNPTARNLGVILRHIAEDLGVKLRVTVSA